MSSQIRNPEDGTPLSAAEITQLTEVFALVRTLWRPAFSPGQVQKAVTALEQRWRALPFTLAQLAQLVFEQRADSLTFPDRWALVVVLCTTLSDTGETEAGAKQQRIQQLEEHLAQSKHVLRLLATHLNGARLIDAERDDVIEAVREAAGYTWSAVPEAAPQMSNLESREAFDHAWEDGKAKWHADYLVPFHYAMAYWEEGVQWERRRTASQQAVHAQQRLDPHGYLKVKYKEGCSIEVKLPYSGRWATAKHPTWKLPPDQYRVVGDSTLQGSIPAEISSQGVLASKWRGPLGACVLPAPPQARNLTADDIPPGSLLRYKGDQHMCSLVTEWSALGVHTAGGKMLLPWSALRENMEINRPVNRTRSGAPTLNGWEPCWIVE